MIKYFIIGFIIGQLLTGCGEDSGGSQTSASGFPTANTPGNSGPAAEPGCTGLASCSPPAGTVFSFTKPEVIGLSACTVSKARFLVSGKDFVAVLKANCQGSQALYSLKVSGQGIPLTAPTWISKACGERTLAVDKFSADLGQTSILAVYSCSASTVSSAKNVHTVVLDMNGQPISHKSNVRTGVTSSFRVKWQESSQQFGVAYSDLLQRYDSAGVAAGGAALIPASASYGEDIQDLKVSDSSWQIIKGSSYSQACSKITSQGILTCTNKTLNLYNSVVESGNTVLIGASYGSLTHTLFSPEICTDSRPLYVGMSSELSMSTVYGSVSVAGGYEAVLMQTTKQTLAVSVFKPGETAVLAMSPVANVSAGQVDAQIGVGGDGMVFVGWVDGNVVNLVMGE